MNERVKQLWLDALRSGTYKKARYSLRDGNKYCAGGVLCDLYWREGPGQYSSGWRHPSDGSPVPFLLYRRGINQPPYEFEAWVPGTVLEWAGLDREDAKTIQNLNDGVDGDETSVPPLPFSKIAEFIEDYL